MRSSIIFLLFAFFFISIAPANSLRGPVEAFTFDGPTHSLRAVNGFPGSATFGAAILSGIDYASVAPSKTYGIAFKEGQLLFVSGLDSAHAATAVISGAQGQPEGTAWSSDGATAVLYSRSGLWIQTLSGLPKAPHAAPRIELSALGESLSAIAADKPAKQVAIAMPGGVFLNNSSQKFIPLAKIVKPVALAFSEDGANLFVVDRSAPALIAIRLSDWSSQTYSLSGLRDPFALRAGLDAAHQPLIYIASHSDGVFAIYSPAAEKIVSTFHLRFHPTGIEDFGRDSFALSSRIKPGDPLWLFSRAPRPEIFFVPAAPAAAKGVE